MGVIAVADQANLLNETGDLEGALSDANRAVLLAIEKQNKDLIRESFFSRYVQFLKLGKPQKAINDLNYLIANYPDRLDTYFSRSQIYSDFGKYDLAILDINRCIEKSPGPEPFLYMKAKYLLNMGKEDKALSIFLELKKDGIYSKKNYTFTKDIHYYMAKIYFNKKDYQKALKEIEKVFRIEGWNWQEWEINFKDMPTNLAVKKQAIKRFVRLRGNIYFNMEKYPEAVADYSYAIKLEKNTDDLYYKRALAYYRLNKWEKVINDIKLAFSLTKDNKKKAYCRWLEANALYMMGDHSISLTKYKEALILSPIMPKLYNTILNDALKKFSKKSILEE